MSELIHLPPILFGLLTVSSSFPEYFSSPSALLASIILTIVINWTGWLVVVCVVIAMSILIVLLLKVFN